MNSESLPLKSSSGGGQSAFAIADEIPLTVRQAAVFLGVSPQTVYLWVERKQIPHLRVMGRNIRFLKSDLEPFRATFKQEVGIWQDLVNMMAPCIQAQRRKDSMDESIETGRESASGNRRLPKTGRRRSGNFASGFRPETTSILEIVRKGEQLQFSDLGGFFPGELFQAAHPRREDTRGQLARGLHLKEGLRRRRKLGEISADDIEHVSAPAASGASPDQDRRRCYPDESG